MYLEKINGPADVKKLDSAQLKALAQEMREAMLARASVHGGHFVRISASWKPPSPCITSSILLQIS